MTPVEKFFAALGYGCALGALAVGVLMLTDPPVSLSTVALSLLAGCVMTFGVLAACSRPREVTKP